MANPELVLISKSDFLLYLEAPRHLWAKKNERLGNSLSDFAKHLIDEGYTVEGLAHQYFETVFNFEQTKSELLWQKTFTNGSFEVRTDALIYKPNTETYDLYEIKSATTPDTEDIYDVTYQAMVLKDLVNVDHYYIIHLNKEYIHEGELDLSQLFIADDDTEKVIKFLPEVIKLSQEALQAAQASNPDLLLQCLKPKSCPCPDVCHPDLPDFSIYDIPYLDSKKKFELLKLGILEAAKIPKTFGLNQKQRTIAEMSKTKIEYVDQAALKFELEGLQFPLWFLDYETCISAIPKYNGYHPQQQIVFQYSLHKLDHLNGELEHTGYIEIVHEDPSLFLLEQLSKDIGKMGTVIVWNKTFEMTMNKEMSKLHPEYSDFLLNLNSRIYDLGSIISQGVYLNPGFKGSWSIKNVLPVMVPELNYQELTVNKGDQASMVWWNMTFGNLSYPEKMALTDDLKQYCALDTLAMVQIYKRFMAMI